MGENKNLENQPEKKEDPRIGEMINLRDSLVEMMGMKEYYKEVKAFMDSTKENNLVVNIHDYAAYHIAIYSSPNKSWSDFPENMVDLPEHSSILTFLRTLDEKYPNEKNKEEK